MYISNSKKEQSIKKLKKQTTRKQSIKKLQEQTTRKQRIKQSMTSFLLPKKSNKTEIESTIESIISNITKQDISADEKIQMICEKLSHLETIDFHGVLIIPYSNSIVSDKEVTRRQTLGGTNPPPTLDIEYYERLIEDEEKKEDKDKNTRRIDRIQERINELERQMVQELAQFHLCEEAHGKIADFEELTNSLIDIDKNDKFESHTKLKPDEAVKNYTEFRKAHERYINLQYTKTTIETLINNTKDVFANTGPPSSAILTEETVRNKLSLANLFDITATDFDGILELLENNKISVKNAKKAVDVWEKRVTDLKDEQLKMFSKGYNPVPTPITTIDEYVSKFLEKIDFQEFNKRIQSYFSGQPGKTSTAVIHSNIYSVTYKKPTGYDGYHMYSFLSKSDDPAFKNAKPREMENRLHFTIHLGPLDDFDLFFNSGKTHMKGKENEEKVNAYSEKANMAPHIYTRESKVGFKVGPSEIIQVVPIYPGNSYTNNSVYYIGKQIQRILNETLMSKQTLPPMFNINDEVSLLKTQIKIKINNNIRDNNRTDLNALNTQIQEKQERINNPETNMGNRSTIYLEKLTEISNKITTFLEDDRTIIASGYSDFLNFLFAKLEKKKPDTGEGKYKRKRLTKVSKKRPHKIYKNILNKTSKKRLRLHKISRKRAK